MISQVSGGSRRVKRSESQIPSSQPGDIYRDRRMLKGAVGSWKGCPIIYVTLSHSLVAILLNTWGVGDCGGVGWEVGVNGN